MANFDSIGESLKGFDVERTVKDYFSDKSVQKTIIETLSNRLFKVGLKKDGVSITTDRGNPYTSFTSQVKASKGEPYNRVTLADSGDLYDSMEAQVSKNQLLLVADFDNAKYKSGIFTNFQKSFANKKEFRETVMSLTETEIKSIIDNLFSAIIEEFKKEI